MLLFYNYYYLGCGDSVHVLKLNFLCLFLIVGDQIFPANFHPAVPLDDVVWLVNSMQREGRTFINSLKLLHRNKFPAAVGRLLLGEKINM